MPTLHAGEQSQQNQLEKLQAQLRQCEVERDMFAAKCAQLQRVYEHQLSEPPPPPEATAAPAARASAGGGGESNGAEGGAGSSGTAADTPQEERGGKLAGGEVHQARLLATMLHEMQWLTQVQKEGERAARDLTE